MEEKTQPTDTPSWPDDRLVQSTYIKPQARKLHDPDVTFEEYVLFLSYTSIMANSYLPI